MPIKTVPEFRLPYYLVCVDATGAERTDDPDGINGRLIPRLTEVLAKEPYTDVFLMSHGWMGDVPNAIRQYNRWVGAMATCEVDIERATKVRTGFRPLLVGFHWPSLPYGDEEMCPGSAVSFSTSDLSATAALQTTTLIDAYSDRIANTPAAREALEIIFSAAAADAAPPELPPEVTQAFGVLDREAGLGSGGPSAAPGSDREPFDPEALYQSVLDDSEVTFGSFGIGPVIRLLQNLSFFKMKDRARLLGETSVHTLLATLQGAVKETGRDVRFHLMGHSFGCIVMSATLAGPPGKAIAAPVNSAFLAQGALSLWSYCSDIPYAKGSSGYFRSIIDAKRVSGAVVTTQSKHDTAVCKAYPAACFVRRDVAFAPGEFPKYGALGAFGARGAGVEAVNLKMLDWDQPYAFDRGKIYNIESSQYIAKMESLSSGAHNDIAHRQVAHAMWSAVLL